MFMCIKLNNQKCSDISTQQYSLTLFFPNGPVLYPLKMSENLSCFQMAPGGTKIEHWEVNGLTHVVLFC